ncbi:hypothetical protein RJ640_011825 [Escallonia rubra]|nr:hypothetical protein RJ640_027574 [Escallonia rubra]KAK2991348.1 hypothetical protein RJ640_011825 [Escallonia rubra]
MFRRNPTNQSHQRNNGDWNARENSDACYECGRTGHIKKYCPQLKNKTANSNSRDFKEKKFKSRKALLTWDDSDESDKEGSEDEDVAQLCFMANDDDLKHNDIWLWHRRLGHVHMDLIKKLLSKDLVRGLPNLRFIKDKICDACQYGLWYPRNSSIDLVGFSDSDYAGCLVDRKSTSGTCQFLGDALVSWHSKKQTSVALSTAEAEYVAAGSCCAQVLWMRQTLQDFGVSLALIPIMCDSSSAIDIRRVSDIVLRFELAPEASWYSERLE